MRIVGGTLRGRKLGSGIAAHVRPTADRVREAMFSTLLSMGDIAGKRVLDLYAGTGALGIEAISRGAGYCLFVENDKSVVSKLRSTLLEFDIADLTGVCAADTFKFLRDPRTFFKGKFDETAAFDLVFADPPYDDFAPQTLLPLLLRSGLLANEATVVLESRELEAEEEFLAILSKYSMHAVKTKTYGGTSVHFLQRLSEGAPLDE